MAANPLSALVTRRSGRLSWRLRGAAEAGATTYRRGSSSRGTPGHYAPGPVTARKLPRRRVGPACEQPSGRLGQFQHAAKRLGRRRLGECRPGACDSIAGIRRGVRVSWRTGCDPAFGARLSVPAVPADVRACLAAIRHQQGPRERNAAHGALGDLQRPQLPSRGCRRIRLWGSITRPLVLTWASMRPAHTR